MKELVDKLCRQGQVPKALNHSTSQDAGEEYKLLKSDWDLRLGKCLARSTLDQTSQLQAQSSRTSVRTSKKTKFAFQERDLMELLGSLER